MKPLIIANWKCNPTTLKGAKLLFNSVKKGIKGIKNVEVVICPPFVYLPILLGSSAFASKSRSYSRSSVAFGVGGQNCFWEEKGAFTGEISPPMLKDFGCQYVILGHSERRKYFSETDEVVNKKIRAAIAAKLNPIFCIGETQTEREKGLTKRVIKSQIKKGLKEITKKEIKQIIIAYEPVWAIGTGRACLPTEAGKICDFIRKVISQIYSKKIARNNKILYGGSVNSQNAALYVSEVKFQGLLVGGASLNSEEFIEILKNVSETCPPKF